MQLMAMKRDRSQPKTRGTFSKKKKQREIKSFNDNVFLFTINLTMMIIDDDNSAICI